ncbi:MAG: hexose kinase [Acidobacteria bacterium]|nr:hexose kinase [Acidobacteriota bacterium]
MILTLTINPAVDRTVLVDHLVFEDRGYILSRSEAAGGRGINASRVLHSFGAKTAAILTSGGGTGEKMEELLRGDGFPVHVVKIRGESRTNLTISDKQGLTVKLNELGPSIDSGEIDALTAMVEARIRKATWLMICGSLPPGVPAHIYRDLIRLARKNDVKTLLDADGDALLHGIEGGPTVVTPNQPEAERLLNRALLTRNQFLEAVQRIKAMGPESVILSLGSRGVVATDGTEMIEALPPRIDALCPLGAGDALAAAFTWSMSRKRPFADAVRWGVAAGTASAAMPGMTFADLAKTKETYRHVTVRPAH